MAEKEYIVPRNLPQLFEAVRGREGEVKFIAGCTNFLPDLRARSLDPKVLVDLTGLEEMTHIREEDGTLSIGATATMSDVTASDLIREKAPILVSAARQLGNPLTRNRATIGGNLANASPAADTAPPLLALEATVHTAGPGGRERAVPVDEFFVGPNTTVLEEGEVLTHITFQEPKDCLCWGHIKLGLRDAMAISVASVAVMLEMREGICTKARIALGSVAPKPIRAYLIEKELEGNAITDEVLERCEGAVDHEISPISDIRASAAYRRLVTKVLLKRAVRQALERREKP